LHIAVFNHICEMMQPF